MTRAVLSIGANLGDPVAALRSAAEKFRPWLRAASSVYRTPPWGPVAQDEFRNAVLIVDDSTAGPRDWLARAHAAEQAAGRVRQLRWGPRTLDVDLVVVDHLRSDDPQLTLPHPRAHERAFVLVPWREVDPTATLHGRPLREWIARLASAEVQGVRRDRDAPSLLERR
jgi:2-amino-4-hydroxy-6-hydroxymethyldihydropteridine diphosphokinase